jgi:hypothetical protein
MTLKMRYSKYLPGFSFPLENRDEYKGLIRFEAYDEDYKTLANIASDVLSDVAPGEAPLTSREYLTEYLKGSQYETVKGRANNKIPRGEVSLFLPQSIQIQDNMQYGPIDLGAIGATAFTAARNGSQALGAMATAGKDVLEDIATTLTGDLGAAGTAAAVQRTAKRFGADQVAGAVATATGVTINPNNRNIFNGVALRTFRFQFKLIPTSKEEAMMIDKIIKFFRVYMYPDIGVPINQAEGISLTLKYPSKFNISMEYGDFSSAGIVGETKQVATGILPCFLQGFDAVYNPNAMAFHNDGNPQEVDISMNFMEERALNRLDVEQDRLDADPYFNDPTLLI